MNQNNKFVTGVIVLLATILTSVSLAMIAVSASERSSDLTETILLALLSGSIALSAHLLPALTRKRVGKKAGVLVSVIWFFSVLVTLYSHTVFFISTTSNAGNVRAENSVAVQDIQKIAQQNQQLAQSTGTRSITEITNDKLDVEKSLIDLNRRNCEKCKVTQSRIQQRQDELQALNIELQQAQKAEASRDKMISLNEKALEVKNSEKLDPVTQKLSLIFKGFNVDAMTLFISVVSAALLEALAALFWWLVWPNDKVHSKINMNNFIEKNKEKEKEKDIENDKKIKYSVRKEISLLEEKMKDYMKEGDNKILSFLDERLEHLDNKYFKINNLVQDKNSTNIVENIDKEEKNKIIEEVIENKNYKEEQSEEEKKVDFIPEEQQPEIPVVLSKEEKKPEENSTMTLEEIKNPEKEENLSKVEEVVVENKEVKEKRVEPMFTNLPNVEEESNQKLKELDEIFSGFSEKKEIKKEQAEPTHKVIVPKDPEINPLIENPLLELDIPDFLNKTLTGEKIFSLKMLKNNKA